MIFKKTQNIKTHNYINRTSQQLTYTCLQMPESNDLQWMNWHYLFTSYRWKKINFKLCVSLKNIGQVHSCFLRETDTWHPLSSSGDGHLIQEWTGNFRPITGKLLQSFTFSGKLSSSFSCQLKQLISVHRTFTASEADSGDA